jgi:hypothetical protein
LEVAGQIKITGGSPGAGKVLTSDATGLATWQTPYAPYAPSDVKTTNPAVHDGNFGGYRNMYNWIQNNGCSGYHVCDAIEITRWLQNGGSIPLGIFWYNSGTYNGGTVTPIYDCAGWTTNSSSAEGSIWWNSSNENYPWAGDCSVSRPVLCCK